MSLRHPVRLLEGIHVIHMNESCHTHEWFTAYIGDCARKACTCARRKFYEWVMSHIWVSEVTHMSESGHTYEWVMSHIWLSHVTHMRESCHTYEWVVSHIWVSHVTHMSESCHTYEWVMSHIWVSRGLLVRERLLRVLEGSHAIHMNESCHKYEWIMSQISMSHALEMSRRVRRDSCHTYECVMAHTGDCARQACRRARRNRAHRGRNSHSYVMHDSLICVPWLPEAHGHVCVFVCVLVRVWDYFFSHHTTKCALCSGYVADFWEFLSMRRMTRTVRISQKSANYYMYCQLLHVLCTITSELTCEIYIIYIYI